MSGFLTSLILGFKQRGAVKSNPLQSSVHPFWEWFSEILDEDARNAGWSCDKQSAVWTSSSSLLHFLSHRSTVSSFPVICFTSSSLSFHPPNCVLVLFFLCWTPPYHVSLKLIFHVFLNFLSLSLSLWTCVTWSQNSPAFSLLFSLPVNRDTVPHCVDSQAAVLKCMQCCREVFLPCIQSVLFRRPH